MSFFAQCVYIQVFSLQSVAEKKKRPSKAEVHVDTLKHLLDYLTHFKLIVALDRNLHLLHTMKSPRPGGKTAKPEEFVRVYDILLQVSVCLKSALVVDKHTLHE